jgi:hypothetical protein
LRSSDENRAGLKVEGVDHEAKTVKLKSGDYSMTLVSPRADFIGIPLMQFAQHPTVLVSVQVPAGAGEENFTTGHGLNRPGE